MPFLGTTGGGSVKQYGGQANLGYFIKNSLRFRGSNSATLSRTPSVSGNRKVWTWSAWVKRGQLDSASTNRILFGSPSQSGNDGIAAIYFASDQLHTYYDTSGANPYGPVGPRLYRDPAAWMHIVWAVDAANTIHYVYVDNTLVSTDAAYYPPNYDYSMNRSGYTHYFGTEAWGPTNYFDGYMAEVNFVDGQVLTPSAFAKTDATTGQWIPKKYSGTYGTNGFYLDFKPNSSTTYAYGFNSTPSYLSATSGQGIMPTGTQTWSIDFWMKFNSAPSVNWDIIHNETTGGVQIVYIAASNRMEIGAYGQADVLYSTVYPNSLVNSWNHFVATHDGTNLRIMMNGVLLASTTTYTFASAGTTRIGTNDTSSGGTLAGYISNLRVCVGSIPTSYQTSATTYGVKVYTPPTSDVTATSQGATSGHVTLLTCQGATVVDSSPTPKTLTMTGTVASVLQPIFSQQIFVDKGGNGNNWLQSNTQTGVSNTSTYDAMTDVPTLTNATTANYCVLNPLDKYSNVTLTNGNLSGTFSAYTGFVRGSMALPSTGKWYWEGTVPTSDVRAEFGIATFSQALGADPQTAAGCWFLYSNGTTTYKYNAGTGTAFGTAWVSGNIVGIAFDADAGTLSFYLNGTLQGGGVAASGLTGTYAPMLGFGNNTSTAISVNFGQQSFAYTPPSGFKALNTYNLP
jgi:hypothetical protein